jgi:hypothetical protein
MKEMVLLHNLLGEMSSREPRSIELGDVLLIPLSAGPLVKARTQFGQKKGNRCRFPDYGWLFLSQGNSDELTDGSRRGDD